MFNWRTLVRRRVICNMTNGGALRGILVRQRGPLLFLADAQLHDTESGQTVPVDGEAIVERQNVDWIQILPGE